MIHRYGSLDKGHRPIDTPDTLTLLVNCRYLISSAPFDAIPSLS